jgi:hypothetical protein
MSKFVVINGDNVLFTAGTFGAAQFVSPPPPVPISGSAKLSSGSPVCVEGDEKSVVLSGIAYVNGSFVGGLGTLKIEKLSGDQVAQKLEVGGKKVILVGSQFDAVFEVVTPAQTPSTPPSPDATPRYSGKGTFVTSNQKLVGA